MEYIAQRGLPEHLKRSAIARSRETFDILDWPYAKAKEVLQWVNVNNHVLMSVGVFLVEEGEFYPVRRRWNYSGDRNKSRGENLRANVAKANEFVDTLNTVDDYWYEVFFKAEASLSQIDREFLDKAVLHGVEITYRAPDALDIIKRARELNQPISGLEAFMIEGITIQPMDYMSYGGSIGYEQMDPEWYLNRFHVKKNADAGHWEEALQWVKERADNGWTFEI